jgi:hypothetical protein
MRSSRGGRSGAGGVNRTVTAIDGSPRPVADSRGGRPTRYALPGPSRVGRVSMAIMAKMFIDVIRRGNRSSRGVRSAQRGECFLVAMSDQKRDGQS